MTAQTHPRRSSHDELRLEHDLFEAIAVPANPGHQDRHHLRADLSGRLAEAGERHFQVFGQLDIVAAGQREIAGDRQPDLLGCLEHAHSLHVRGGKNGGRPLRPVEQLPACLVAALHREGCVAHQARIVGHAARRKGLAVAVQASNGAGHVGRPGHVPDPAMTALQQMVGHQAAGLQIIHHHVVGTEVGEVAQEQDKRDPGSLQQGDVAAIRLGRRQDQPVDLLRLQHGQAAQRLFLVFGRIAQEQAVADGVGRALDRMHDRRVDRAGAVGDDQAEGLGRARSQRLRHRAGHVVQPFGHRQDPGPRLGTELALVVQGARHGGVRDPSFPGDVMDGDRHSRDLGLG